MPVGALVVEVVAARPGRAVPRPVDPELIVVGGPPELPGPFRPLAPRPLQAPFAGLIGAVLAGGLLAQLLEPQPGARTPASQVTAAAIAQSGVNAAPTGSDSPSSAITLGTARMRAAIPAGAAAGKAGRQAGSRPGRDAITTIVTSATPAVSGATANSSSLFGTIW